MNTLRHDPGEKATWYRPVEKPIDILFDKIQKNPFSSLFYFEVHKIHEKMVSF